jgi:LuxR family maltose regulon positive regulatory protein
MPKVAAYTLAWSPSLHAYVLFESQRKVALDVVPGSPTWFAWLAQVSSFAFSGQAGSYTARKEAARRGDRYWYAYLRSGQKLAKKYLGKTADLNLARLEEVAGVLHADRATAARMPEPTTSPPAQNEAALPLVPLDGSRVDASAAPNPHTPPATLGDRLSPLLATKLHLPRPRMQLVTRIHLLERLQQGVEGPLTLVSAPAGFGKTTLLAQWLAESGMPVAWLSLEAEDNDPTRFLSYLIAALQTLDAQVGAIALAMLRTPQPPSPEAVLAVLTNDLVERGGEDVALVLDDYHIIATESIQLGMTFLLEHLPPQLHLILATRADPPLPLARLRARGLLTEVRTADLRFEAAEAGTFLQDVMGLDLPPEAVATLERYTEGWIAGLQLAALSLQGGTEISAFLAAFSGSHRYVFDYLYDEVLARQPEAAQQFLLHTCLLERLSGPLCDVVTGQEGSQAMLEAIERANLFVVALDEERRWYRYHHLFAQALRSHLQQREPALVPQLHRRASAWYEQHVLPAEAVQHALAIPDTELAARLIEPIALSTGFQGQLNTALEWMSALPEALVRTRPRLCVYHAVLLMFTNQMEAAEARVLQAERSIQEGMPAEQAKTIMGWVLNIRGDIVLNHGDIPQAVSLAQKALMLLPEAEVIPHTGALATTIRAYLMSGDVTLATEHEVSAAVAFIRPSGNQFSIVSSTCLLARLHVLQGRLHQAAAAYEQVAQMVSRPEVLQTMFSSIFYFFGLGDLLYEWNELDAAERHLMQGMALVKETRPVEPFVAILGYIALARLLQASGKTHEALATLDALIRLVERRHFAAYLLPKVAAVGAQLELAQDNMAAAIRWADSSGLSTMDEDLPYPREGEYLALARVRIAQARGDPVDSFLPDVLRLLNRLLLDAEAKARLSSVLELLVLRALALEVQGNRTSALSNLERALVLAEPECYIHLFVDEGPPMRALLRLAHRRGIIPEYVATLLSAFEEQHTSNITYSSPRPDSLLEPLTGREREVLRLLLEGASNREIARHLVLSVNTVKRHVYNLCGKLGVQSRTQAIIRARDLHLL